MNNLAEEAMEAAGNHPLPDGIDFCRNSSVADIFQFNFSQYDYPGEGGGPWPPPLGLISALKIAFCIVNMIVSILGNTAVMIAVYHNPVLRSTINFYLVNLAVADVLIALCCMWPHLVNDLTKPAYVLGPFMCKFNAFAQMTCLTSSVLTLTAISCDRFMAVMYPLRVRITQCRARAVIISIWIISVVVALPFAVYRKLFEIQWRNAVEVTCQETWPVMRVDFDPIQSSCVPNIWPKTVYYSLVSAMLFFLPIVVMTIAYALIIVRLWGSKPPGEKMDATMSNQAKATRKKILLGQVVKMVLVILLVFIICWVPLQILILYAQFSHNSKENGELPEWYEQVVFLVYSIAYTNSTLNPLLYGGLNQTYRKTLIRVLCRKCCHCRIGRESSMSVQGSLRLAEFRATRGPSASPYPAGIGHDESCTSTNTTRFGGRRGMLLAANSTPLPQICAGSSTEGTRSSLATKKGGHQKKTVRISSQHSPTFTRAPSLEVMRSHHSLPYPSSSKHQRGADANPAGHYSSPAAVEYDENYSTTMTSISRSSRSNRNR